jgi:hypothetical protein
MRLTTIVVCLVLVSPPSALACYEHAAEQTGWLHETPSSYRGFAAESAEEAMMLGLSLAGAGLASLALAVMSFRIFSRGPGRARSLPVEFEPAASEEATAPGDAPGEPRIRIDQAHERPEPTWVGRDEEASWRVLEMV